MAYHAAAPVVPVIVLAFLFQGFFLLSSIGITITKEARYYPMITAAAATLNIVLEPLRSSRPSGSWASAWATVAGYALMALLGAIDFEQALPDSHSVAAHRRRLHRRRRLFSGWSTLLGHHIAGALARAGLALAFTALRLARDPRRSGSNRAQEGWVGL